MRAFSISTLLAASVIGLSWCPVRQSPSLAAAVAGLSWQPVRQSPLLAAALTGLSRHVVQQSPPDYRPTLPGPMSATLKKTQESLQGAWRLTQFTAPRFGTERREQNGFVLIHGVYFAIEIHVGWMDVDNVTLKGRTFQSGTYRYTLDETGRMDMSSVIGAVMNTGVQVTFEPPGTKRHFKLELVENRMTLRGEDDAVFTFERMLDAEDAPRDIYGRPIVEKKPPAAKPTQGKSSTKGDKGDEKNDKSDDDGKDG
jgi:hypothetical protein